MFEKYRGRRALLAAATAATGALAAPSLALAQGGYPSRPITIIVPSPAGGGTDFSARLISEPLGRALGTSVVVENRPGGNDVVGLNAVLQARPDGHTLLMGYCGTMTGRAALGSLGQIDTLRDFVPIGQVSDTPQLFVTHPTVPVSTMREFVAYARQRPGQLTYASAGNGSMHHLSVELLKIRTGIDLLHVPYRGTGETIRDLVAGRVQFYLNSPPPLVPLVRDGRLRPLAVSSNERHPGLSDIPSAAEEGLPDLNMNVWFALYAPRGTPEDITRLVSAKLNEVLADPGLRQRAFEAGALVTPLPVEAITARMQREIANWTEVVRAAGITA
ncbi:Bug family tripartite tricarboxylate transporter substrate binding protein [Sabulicella rubraurantiaca]|uniref:Bug family tripartite tricarboxylate transporter substrate binding protein n=1 Tax=Sabulicella rubraurantiaca TaxID=2811429 RepID=UPI001A96D162|nr:tripartite tricarboxylate transporter substrate binding protein [Sabulicella rubraurantiaca]